MKNRRIGRHMKQVTLEELAREIGGEVKGDGKVLLK